MLEQTGEFRLAFGLNRFLEGIAVDRQAVGIQQRDEPLGVLDAVLGQQLRGAEVGQQQRRAVAARVGGQERGVTQQRAAGAQARATPWRAAAAARRWLSSAAAGVPPVMALMTIGASS